MFEDPDLLPSLMITQTFGLVFVFVFLTYRRILKKDDPFSLLLMKIIGLSVLATIVAFCIISFMMNVGDAFNLDLGLIEIIAFVIGSAFIVEIISEIRKHLHKILLAVSDYHPHSGEEE